MPLAKRLLPLVLVVGLVGGLIAWLFVFDTSPPGGAPFEAEGLTLLAYTQGADVAWEIRAEQGDVNDANSSLQGVEIDFHTAREGTLTATAGQLHRSEGSARLSEGVLVERDDGLRLETDDLTWDESAKFLDAGAIALTMDDLSVHAGSFRYDLDEETASLGGGVRLVDEGERSFVATGKHAEESNGTFVLEGNVEAEIEEGSLRAQTLAISDEGLTADGDVTVRLILSGDADGQPEAEENDESERQRSLNGA